MAKDSKERCPVCDSGLLEEVEECPNCGAVLKLFDIDVDVENGISKEAFEKVKSLILEEGGDEELLEKIGEMEFSAIVNEDDETISTEETEDFEEIVTFACPICDSEVGENDSQCPNCGAIFEVESDEEEEPLVDFQDEIDLYQKKIKQFERSGLGIKYLKKEVSKLEEAQNKGDEKRGEILLEEIQDKIEHVENIMRITTKCENFLSVLSEKLDVSDLEKKVDKIYEGCDIGEYQVASKRGDKIQKEIVEKLNGLEEKKWLRDLIEEKSEEARELISEIKSDVDIDRVEEKIGEALSAKNDGDLEDGLHNVTEALNSASKILEISENIEEANKYLEDIKQKGIDASEYEEEIDNTIRDIETGEELAAFEIIERTIEDMQNSLEKYEEEKEKQELEELSEKIEEEISQMEALLEQAKKFDIGVIEGEEKIDEALTHAEEDEYEEGLTKLEEVDETYRGKVEDEIDRKIDSMKEGMNENVSEEASPFEKIEELKDKGDYEKILELLEDMEKEMESQKEIKDGLTEFVSEIERIIGYSENLDFDMKDVRDLLEDTEEQIEKGDWSEAEDHLKSCRKKIRKKLLHYLKGEYKSAKKKLKGIDREDIDVKKPVELIKKANRARKENRLKESFETLNDYKEEMDKIDEKI
ncbi:MAG: hypothetical protein ACOC87_01535 [Candidatus Natronoplasma sp.]